MLKGDSNLFIHLWGKMEQEQIANFIEEDLPDEVLEHLMNGVAFSIPWQYGANTTRTTDADGAPLFSGEDPLLDMDRTELQRECWKKAETNPQVNTAIRDEVGRLTGLGFETSSEVEEIQDEIELIENDWRNRLYNFWPKYIGRFNIEGEMHLCLTCHQNGFVEIDHIKPADIDSIIWHPFKTVLPLFYNIKLKDSQGLTETHQIPSVYIARSPKEMIGTAQNFATYNRKWQKTSRSLKHSYKATGGYKRFIVSMDKGMVTRRATGHLKTILTWLNKYEMLKNWEIDHKRSAGAYLWVITCEDTKKYKKWLSLSDEDKKKTALTGPKTPGGTIYLPPGFSLDCKFPQLPNISDSDTDIMGMIVSGLNANESSVMGSNKGNLASVKESKGPQSDRTSNEMAYFKRFLIHDFWGNIFFLKHLISGFPATFRNREAYKFQKKEPKFKLKKRRPEELIEISFPVSEAVDTEGRAKAALGTKHGPLNETLQIPDSDLAGFLGFHGYGRKRLKHASERDRYPDLIYGEDAESVQEKAEGEALIAKPNKKKDGGDDADKNK